MAGPNSLSHNKICKLSLRENNIDTIRDNKGDDTMRDMEKQEIGLFLKEWSGSREEMKERVEFFLRHLEEMAGVALKFVARPGVSYSIRPYRLEQEKMGRTLFAMIDVIDDEPSARWLSICFYGDMITDPKDMGEVIPGGLAGEDGYCFDMFEDDEEYAMYLLERLQEASIAAKRAGA